MTYTTSLDGITADQLQGFFVGWPNPPNPETHLKILQGSTHILLAIDDTDGKVVGFINAISDGVLNAFIPLLEVLPSHQHQGIGAELVRQMLDTLRNLYAIDLLCDADLQPFYERFGMRPYSAMLYRNYDRQSGV
ncbi:MAG: GNAT family N-acetyltransferase [Anaerolineaceae bacterium]|nr:GNAT family N-acetyltransferase [Anaerolineaceae bacterium]